MSDASTSAPPPIIDLIDDGMTDEEIAAKTSIWLDHVRSTPGVVLPETAVEALTALEGDGELWPT